MKIRTSTIIVFFMFLIATAIFAAAVVSLRPVADAYATQINAPADPFDQLLQSRQASAGGFAWIAVALVLILVVIGIGWYALSGRTASTLRAAKALAKPAKTITRIQPVPVGQFPQITAAENQQIDGTPQITAGQNQGSQQWPQITENSS